MIGPTYLAFVMIGPRYLDLDRIDPGSLQSPLQELEGSACRALKGNICVTNLESSLSSEEANLGV